MASNQAGSFTAAWSLVGALLRKMHQLGVRILHVGHAYNMEPSTFKISAATERSDESRYGTCKRYIDTLIQYVILSGLRTRTYLLLTVIAKIYSRLAETFLVVFTSSPRSRLRTHTNGRGGSSPSSRGLA